MSAMMRLLVIEMSHECSGSPIHDKINEHWKLNLSEWQG